METYEEMEVSDFSIHDFTSDNIIKKYDLNEIEEVIYLNTRNGLFISCSLGDLNVINIFDSFINGSKASEILSQFDNDVGSLILSQIYFILTENKVEFNLARSLSSIKIDITYNCDLRCSHCFQGYDVKKETSMISFEKIKKIVESYLSAGPKEPQIVLSGGEPFTHPEIDSIVDYISQNNIKLFLMTNGKILSKKPVSYLKELFKKIDGLQFSLDGLNSETHETRRGGSNHSKLLDIIAYSSKNGIDVDVTITVNRENADELLNNYYNFRTQEKFKNVNFVFNRVMDIGAATDNILSSYEFSIFMYKLYSSIQSQLNIKLENTFEDQIQEKRNCNMLEPINFTFKGDVNICGFIETDVLGNIENNSVNEIWQKLYNIWLKNDQINMEECSNCDVSGFCSGHCRIYNKLKKGNYLSPGCTRDNFRSELINMVMSSKFANVMGMM